MFCSYSRSLVFLAPGIDTALVFWMDDRPGKEVGHRSFQYHFGAGFGHSRAGQSVSDMGLNYGTLASMVHFQGWIMDLNNQGPHC